jgi:hypothetical protein
VAGRAAFAEHEANLRAVFERAARGRRLPAWVRQLGAEVRPAVVFGYDELRERVLLAASGLDPSCMELFKREILLRTPALQTSTVATLAVEGVDGDRIALVVEQDDGTRGPALVAERSAYAAVAAQGADLARFYPGLFQPGWQSLRRYRAGAPRPPAATG